MAITTEEIVDLYYNRVREMGPLHMQMRRISELVNGGIVIPLNELDVNAKPGVANLISQGLYQMSRLQVKVFPTPYWPVLKDGNEKSKEDARVRVKATKAMWNENNMPMILRQRGPHLLAHSLSAVSISVHPTKDIPMWKVRNPLDTFPAPVSSQADMLPDNCIFADRVTAGWLMKHYPEQTIGKLRFGDIAQKDLRYTTLEYMSDECTKLIVLGAERSSNWPNPDTENAKLDYIGLEYVENRIGRPLAVVANRITLDKPHGYYDDAIGMHYTRARMQALTEIAIEQGIFPKIFVVSRDGQTATVVREPNSKKGQTGVIQGGTVEVVNINPGYKTDQALDRMERQERLEAMVPAEMGGEAGSNIRTGRRGEQLFSSAVDPIIDEIHATFETSMVEENKIAIAFDRTYFGKMKKSFFIPSRTNKGSVMETYVPEKLWSTDTHIVAYSTKVDIVELGQRDGIGLNSKESLREMDPMTEDAEYEHDRIMYEQLEQMTLQSVASMVMDPNSPIGPLDMAKIAELIAEKNIPVWAAVARAQQSAQDRQAATVPAGAPEAMPGLMAPAQGPQVQGPPAQRPPIAQLLAGLTAGGR